MKRVGARSDSDLGFRMGTGAFAALVLAIVAAIGVVLFRESFLSIREFGLRFWITDVWDPVAAQFGARPFIWGTIYSSILALLIAAPISLGIATYLSEICPAVLRQPLIFLTELLAASGLKVDYTVLIPERVRAGYVDTTAELGHFLEENPDGLVMTRETGHDVSPPYGVNPYGGYDDINESPFLFQGETDDRLPPMQRLVAISDDDLRELRKLSRELDDSSSPYRCIVSVLMLREGWDVRNVTVVLGLRPFSAKAEILPEQVIGRGLRLMMQVSPDQHGEPELHRPEPEIVFHLLKSGFRGEANVQ